MVRDVGILRKILFQIEARNNGTVGLIDPIEGIEPDVLHGHVELLIEAGFLKAQANVQPFGAAYPTFHLQRLTYSGHEFLDAIRHNSVWERLKSKAREEGGNLPVVLLKELGLKYLREKTGLE